MGLDFYPRQWEAVAAPIGPVLVLAGPGSGKTRCLAFQSLMFWAGLHVLDFRIYEFHRSSISFITRAEISIANFGNYGNVKFPSG